MSTPLEKGYFLELNEYFLLAARTSSLGGPPVIEDLREAPLDSKTAVSQLLNTVFPDTKKRTARAICALRPRLRFFHLAGDSETRQYSTPTALRAFVSHTSEAGSGASELIALQTSSGVPLNGSGKVEGRWIFEGSPRDSLTAMQATVYGWKLAPFRVEAATLAMLGAIHAEQQVNKASSPLLVWEIGETTSYLFLISSKGLMTAKRLAFGFDKVADSVQTELGLKSKESAAKVFFNEFYDFSEIGSKITARISPFLLPAIADLVPAETKASVTLLCTGLPSKQAWFNEHLAKSLSLASWQPDVVGWCSRAGLSFIGNTLQATLSPVWLGLLGVMSAFQADKPDTDSAWHPVWICNGEVPAENDKPAAAAAPPQEPEPAPIPAAATGTVNPPASLTALPAEKAVIAAVSPPPPAALPPATPPPAAVTTAPDKPPAEDKPATPSAASVTSVSAPAPAAAVAPPAPPAAVPTAKTVTVVASASPPAAAPPAKSLSTAATTVPDKPAAGDKSATPSAASATPMPVSAPAAAVAPPPPPAPAPIQEAVAAATSAPAPAAAASVKSPSSAATTVPNKSAAGQESAIPSAVSAPLAPTPTRPATPAPPAPTIVTKKVEAAAIAPTPTPTPTKTRAPDAPKATAKTLIGKAMAIAAEAKPSAEKHVPSSAGATKTPAAPVPELPTSDPKKGAKPLPPAGLVEERGPASAAREAAPNTDAASSATVREASPTPQAPRPLSPLEAEARAKLDGRPVRARPFLRTPAGLAFVGTIVLLAGATLFFYRQFAEEKAAAVRAQAAAEQRAAAETAARRQAEQQAKVEAEARRRAEAEVAQKNAAAEAARQQAAEETRRREIETNRLLNGRGSLVIATEPAGATIDISNLAPRVSPATISDLRLGHYAVKISLPGYDPANLDVEIKDNEVTDSGPIRLVRQTGSLTLATEPAGMNYEVRPAASRFFAAASDLRQGKTPATLADLPTGEYTVIFSREGWPNHMKNVVIERNGAAQASSEFAGGSVTITSTPAGANVKRDGLALGVTPLTLEDVQPGEVSYTLEVPDFIPVDVTGRVEPEKTLRLDATLSSADRIARIAELDERPVPTKTVEPAINPYQERTGGKVTISLTIDRDGTPKDLKVEQASNAQLGRRCLEAAAQWRFNPGKIKGVAVKTRVSLPFNIAPP